MIDFRDFEVWFVTGSQHLYGDKTLKKVAEDSRKIAAGLTRSGKLPVRVVFKPVVTTHRLAHFSPTLEDLPFAI
jgi:L-arabinose isomerase